MSTQRELANRLKELAKTGDIEEVVRLLGTAEAWLANALETALVEATRNQHIGVVTALLDEGASPNGIGGGGFGILTPLHLAARHRNPNLLYLLLDRGAEVDAIDTSTGKTPLHEVLGRGYDEEAHLPLVRMLLDAGADPNRQASSLSKQTPLTPFQLALKHQARETARLLLQHGADLDQRNGDRRTALMIATREAVENNDLSLLEWLLELGADPNAGKHYHETPLTIAARRGRIDLIDYLVGVGADVRLGRALVTAADRGQHEAARRLLELGADVNEEDLFERTALVNVITHHDTDMAKLLIDHGAPFDEPTETYMGEMTPLEYARKDPHYNADIIAHMLAIISARDEEEAHREAGRYHAAGMLKVARDPRVGKPIAHWLEQGADPNARNEYQRTALHYLAERGRPLDEVELLLAAGADPNARDQFGYRPLHDAVLGDEAAIIEALLAAGAEPSATVEEGIHAGYTALEIARIERKETAIHLLEPISPEPRPLTPCEPEFRRDGSVKGFSHRYYEEDVAKNAEGSYIYMRKTSKEPYWPTRGEPVELTEPCVCVNRYDTMSKYQGTGIPRAEHPLRWRIAMEDCLHCGSGDVLVIHGAWGVQAHDGDLVWSYEVKCNECGYYSSWGYDEG